MKIDTTLSAGNFRFADVQSGSGNGNGGHRRFDLDGFSRLRGKSIMERLVVGKFRI